MRDNSEQLLSQAVYENANTEVVELLLKNGANPRNIINKGYISNNKIKKLLVEYGGVDRSEIRDLSMAAIMIGITTFSFYATCCCRSLLDYTMVATFALVAVLFAASATYKAFYAQTKWPYPDFNEVNVEEAAKACATDNSQNVLRNF